MKLKALPLLIALSATAADAALISLNTITPGTESVTLVANGDFELGSGNTNPDSWTRVDTPFYNTDAAAGLTTAGFSNIPTTGKVAYYNVVTAGGNSLGLYGQTISGLLPNTEYVYSAYLWNNSLATIGTAVPIVMDLNDANGEAQLILEGNAANANGGYFAYGSFNTATTGTTFFARVFTNPFDYTSNNGAPIFAWDKVAITLASSFTAPVPEPSTALLGGLGLLVLLRRRR